MRRPVVLVVAGTDPLCGAGLVADALFIAAAGCLPVAVVTAMVDQDSMGVHAFRPIDVDEFERTLARTLADTSPEVAKIGVLATGDHARAVGRRLAPFAATLRAVVIDPVLTGGHDGHALARRDLPGAIRRLAAGLSDRGIEVLLTPNAPELGRILGAGPPTTRAALAPAAALLAEKVRANVLATAGHVEPPGQDVLAEPDGVTRTFEALGRWGTDVHGTGCRLSTSIACALARGEGLASAIVTARRRLHGDMVSGRGVVRLGRGRPQMAPPRYGDGEA